MTTQDTGTVSTDAGAAQTADASTLLTSTPPAPDSTQPATPPADGSTAPAADAGQPTPPQGEQAGEAKPEGDKGAKDGDKPADAPIVYDFKAPEGMELAPADLEAFTSIAQELKLPPEQAQKVVDLAVKREQARITEHADQVKAWGAQVSTDKELGKAENLAAARTAINQFGSPELKALLNTSGLGNHPELVRFALRVGRAISEDGIHLGRGDAPAVKDPAKVLYPNQA